MPAIQASVIENQPEEDAATSNCDPSDTVNGGGLQSTPNIKKQHIYSTNHFKVCAS